jgi:hypothetical protein
MAPCVAYLENRLSRWATLFALVFCFALAGCGDDSAVRWTTKEKSPDGLWVAIANVRQYSGPGQAALYTEVSLARIGQEKDLMQVISLNVGSVREPHVDLRWLTNRHLEVTYYGNPGIDFQAIRSSGLDISLRRWPG